jgi:hypothetical protein
VGRFWNLTTDFDGRPARTDPTSLQAFKSAVALLYREQGRGHRCTVEHYARDECLYLFAYVDDYVETHTAHDAGSRPPAASCGTRLHRRAG